MVNVCAMCLGPQIQHPLRQCSEVTFHPIVHLDEPMYSDLFRTDDTVCAYPRCTKTVWKDPNGSFSLFCGRSHRDEMSKISDIVCKGCQERPVYIENGRIHNFCGKRCMQATRNGQQQPAKPKDVETIGICVITGCSKLVFVDQDGIQSQYCSHAHRLKAVQTGFMEACLVCNKYPKTLVSERLSDFCSKGCADGVTHSAPILLAVPEAHKIFKHVSLQFKAQWKHHTPVPNIVRIWKVYSSRYHYNRFSRYQLSVERRTGLPNGNTQRRWHGTVRACQLGNDESSTSFCDMERCLLCNILKSSFEKAKAGARTNFGRFGSGIYTSATSSKANDYVKEGGETSYKTMLLNQVILGKPVTLTQNNDKLVKAPLGYDSVFGQPGDDLNYDEYVVYKNEAIRPAYLVVFEP